MQRLNSPLLKREDNSSSPASGPNQPSAAAAPLPPRGKKPSPAAAPLPPRGEKPSAAAVLPPRKPSPDTAGAPGPKATSAQGQNSKIYSHLSIYSLPFKLVPGRLLIFLLLLSFCKCNFL